MMCKTVQATPPVGQNVVQESSSSSQGAFALNGAARRELEVNGGITGKKGADSNELERLFTQHHLQDTSIVSLRRLTQCRATLVHIFWLIFGFFLFSVQLLCSEQHPALHYTAGRVCNWARDAVPQSSSRRTNSAGPRLITSEGQTSGPLRLFLLRLTSVSFQSSFSFCAKILFFLI